MLLLLLSLLTAPAQAAEGSAVVDSCAVTVRFAVEEPGSARRWRRKETTANAQEFARMVTVGLNDSIHYKWGLTLWKMPGSLERSGTLSSLVADAQLNFWNEHGRGAVFDTAHAYLRASVEDDGASIVIRMSDPEVLGAILKERPSVFSLEFFDPEGVRAYGPVRPVYKDLENCRAPGFV